MPPKWPREPDRNDPEYRRLDDIWTFAAHVAVFSSVNSGMWFFNILLRANWSWAVGMTAIWASVILVHYLYVFKIANYSPNSNG
jgi:2TM domain